MRIIKWVLIVLLVATITMIAIYAINPSEAPSWTGFVAYDPDIHELRVKTLWDWLELLIVPFVLSAGVWLLSETDKKVELQKELEKQRQEALTSFISKISEMVISNKLLDENNKQISLLARMQILCTFRTLDANRKAEALQAIYELKLINKSPIIKLNGVNLNRINLELAPLVNAEIRGAYFQKANLKKANLTSSTFVGCDFSNSDFRSANLSGTDFSYAKLVNANFLGCDLSTANFEYANLTNAKPRALIKQIRRRNK
jgi:uncharacterized protein YjbI with pentapeptide repeats